MPSQTFTSNGSINIPANAKDVQVTLAAARGGNGGPDAGASAGAGAGGRKATFYFNDFIARTFTLYIGGQGGNGGGCSGNAPGGNGGGGYTSGGTGGRAGPNGCSGGGGGGGGSSAIYDSYKNGIVAVVGGGGGGGGASWNASGESGRPGYGMYTGNLNSPGNGGNGSNCPNDGGGGGGGGGGVGGGGGGYEGYDNNRGGGRGDGGLSAFDSNYCSFNNGTQNYGSGFAEVSYNLQNPVIDSFTVSPTSIIRGQTATLSWQTSFADSASIDNGVGNVSVDGSTTVSPQNGTTYTLTACFAGVCDTDTVTLIVYIPPTLIIDVNRTAIVRGENVTLSWSITGDGDTVYWTSGDPPITNQNTQSFSTVAPLESTTYCGYVTGLGGTSPTTCVDITVYQPPVVNEFETPVEILYGASTITIGYESQYANTTHQLQINAIWIEGPNTGTTLVDTINLPLAASAEVGPNTIVSGTYDWTPTWDDFGPERFEIVYTAAGDGGSVTPNSRITTVIIDRTPDNINIPESLGLIKDEAPVISPDTEIISEQLLVDEIDVAVEVKSNYPIQVQVNNDDQWENIREL